MVSIKKDFPLTFNRKKINKRTYGTPKVNSEEGCTSVALVVPRACPGMAATLLQAARSATARKACKRRGGRRYPHRTSPNTGRWGTDAGKRSIEIGTMSKAGGGGGGRGRKSNFDAVPADDGFRNYMARKIELQRKQFGLVVPPPPPSPPPPVESEQPAPPKILKRGNLAAGNREGVPIPQFANVNAPADASTEKSVRFHHEVEVEGETKPISMSHVLASLKQKHIGGRKRLSSSLKRRRRRSRSPTGESYANEQGSYSSVLGVLGNLQKRHGGAGKSSLKRKRPHNDPPNHKEKAALICARAKKGLIRCPLQLLNCWDRTAKYLSNHPPLPTEL